MTKWLLGALIVILVVVFIIWWRVRRRKHAMRVLMLRNQRLCDRDVAKALTQLAWRYPDPLRSQPVADVWGHGIMAFEYALPEPQTSITSAQFTAALRAQTGDQNAKTATLAPTLDVTDWWHRDGVVHVDVAYVVNAATREYVRDVRRVQ